MREVGTAIVGAGVTGVALARALAMAGERGVVVIEKEGEVAFHTSGRNSGVVHGGYNQKPGTLKARLCVEGNRRLKQFCRDKGVPLVEGGILVVARDQAGEARLGDLLERGQANGAPGLSLVPASGIAAIEPNAVGRAALHAPGGASVDAPAYVRALAEDARTHGAELWLGRRVEQVSEDGSGYRIRLDGETVRAARLVNCAGLHADRLAHSLGAGLEYGVVPIRGEYRRLKPARADLIRSMVYPVPHPEFPFLGVHWTRTAHGEVIIGPNAVPALGREAYRWRDVSGAAEVAFDPRAWRLLGQPGFAHLVWQQVRGSLSTRRFVEEARELVPAARVEDFLPGPAGIRAQMVDRRGRLVDDLVVERKGNALHVLNVVSPGLTCSLAFADELRAMLA